MPTLGSNPQKTARSLLFTCPTAEVGLAFLALAHHHLGHKEQARATLAQLREVMKQPRWEKDAEAAGFLREAQELIEGKAGGKKE